MLEAFVRSFRERFPDLLGRPLVVGLSGGADSVALLCLLGAARPALSCPPAAVHVHHHLRGGDADADAEFCRRLCGALGVDFELLHLDPAPPAGVSPEAWWRSERYRLLDEARERRGAAAVLTAHTADDQAETVLIKLLRGSGPRGLAGVRERHGDVCRPLLGVRRGALRAWLAVRGQAWREDASNADTSRPRGWARHVALPVLGAGWPRATEHLAAFAAATAEDELLLSELAAAVPLPALGAPVALESVTRLPAPLLRRWVLALAARLPLAEPPSRAQLAAVVAMVRGGRPAAVDLGRRWVLRRRRDRVELAPPPVAPWPPAPAAVPSDLELPGGFRARLGCPAGRGHAAWLSARVRAEDAEWRPLAPGERLDGRPICSALAQRGVPAEWRRAWPVLHAGGSIVCVPAMGIGRRWEGREVAAELEEPWPRHERS